MEKILTEVKKGRKFWGNIPYYDRMKADPILWAKFLARKKECYLKRMAEVRADPEAYAKYKEKNRTRMAAAYKTKRKPLLKRIKRKKYKIIKKNEVLYARIINRVQERYARIKADPVLYAKLLEANKKASKEYYERKKDKLQKRRDKVLEKNLIGKV